MTISSLTLINTADKTTDGSSFDKNFMASGTVKYRQAAFFNKPESDSEWQHVPTKMHGQRWLGYRQVYQMDSNRVLVEILELYPIHGRIWSLLYNNGEWSSWTSISPS